MKKLFTRIPSHAVVLLLVLSILACASTPADRILFNTIDDAVTGVQAAVSAFKTAKAQGVIADLDGSKAVRPPHVAEAIGLRVLDRGALAAAA